MLLSCLMRCYTVNSCEVLDLCSTKPATIRAIGRNISLIKALQLFDAPYSVNCCHFLDLDSTKPTTQRTIGRKLSLIDAFKLSDAMLYRE